MAYKIYKSGNVIKITHLGDKEDIKEYHNNGVLAYRKYPNGKEEWYNENKQLIQRNHNDCEEIWIRNEFGKCIEYFKHVYY